MGPLSFRRAAVFGATGSTGRELVWELLRRDIAVRTVSRSADRLARDFDTLEAERFVADLSDPEAAVAAATGCDFIFHCVGLPLERFAQHIRLARNTTAAMREHGARGLLVTSYWSYGPGDGRPMLEDRPLAPGSEKGRIRREMEDIFLDAGGCVARLPDFFGPGSELSFLNNALRSLSRGAAVLWPGDPDAARDHLFVPDAGRLLCDLAAADSYGRAWNVPGSGAAAPRELLKRAARQRGVSLKLRRGRRWMVTLGGLFRREIREFKDVFPLYDRPAVLDTARIRALLGAIQVTPYEEAIRITFEWLEERSS